MNATHIKFLFIFIPASQESSGDRPRRTQNTSQSTAISECLLAPHPDRTKEGWRCSHSTWSLNESVASRTCLTNISWNILIMWPKQCTWDLSIQTSG